MDQHLKLCELLQEIEAISPRLRLRLPATTETIEKQVGRVASASQKLEHVYERVQLLASRRSQMAMQPTYLTLGDLLDEILHNAESYYHLTEELTIDPVGTNSCLKSIDEAIADLLTQITRLKSFLLTQQNIAS
ncbi:MAG TPA: hypothetical protein IGS53_16305 [Leptolyngbyaceae cyanobacterium M33_DOE_097]|uniref:Uncharacterized protein n=1 Tax=Oscillatoriales cyanobacterium SpSt-418 TaxID=2282169 RepID=A0A7C3PHT2_9CYAN|nr:hypothetical protein [Leptolyngbyaceae cyanobacterium M33_DOE_097]